MKLLIFAASHRPQSVNRKLAILASDYAQAHNIDVDRAEYGEFDMPLYNDEDCSVTGVPEIAMRFAVRAADADGIIICSPEYNWSFPGSLKNIIDWTSRIPGNPIATKTVLLMSATPGARGGIIGLQHLKVPLEALQCYVFPKVFPLGRAHLAFTDDHRLADADQHILFTSLLDQYFLFTRKLAAS